MFQFESPEQLEIRESVRRLARKEIPAFQNEKHYGTVPLELFRQFASLGITGLSISEKHGGLGEGMTSSSIVMEEIAAVDLGPAIFLSVHLMVSGLIERFGTPEQCAHYLPRLARGEILGAFALTEASAGSDAANLRCTATRTASGYELRGSKVYITSAGFADVYLVFAKTDPAKGSAGISAFLVEKDTLGLSIGAPEKKMGCELSPIASLNFDAVQLPADSLLGTENEGYGVALSGLAGGRINIAACANGISRSALERAVKHLNEREQFGKKIGEFQGLQFMLADMKMKLEASQLLTWQAASEKDAKVSGPRARVSPSAAKCFATDSAMQISTDAVQLLGGAGYIREYDVERHMRDAKMLQIVEGTNQIQRMVIAREILRESSE